MTKEYNRFYGYITPRAPRFAFAFPVTQRVVIVESLGRCVTGKPGGMYDFLVGLTRFI
jgi:hypothetical protein